MPAARRHLVAARRAASSSCWPGARGSRFPSTLLDAVADRGLRRVVRRRARDDAVPLGDDRRARRRRRRSRSGTASRGAAGRCRSPSALYARRDDRRRHLRRLRPALLVTPNELDKEQPYILHNIDATRTAYALDRVEERELSGDAELTRAGHRRQRGHDRERAAVGPPAAARRRSRRSRKSGRTTTSSTVDNDRYMIDGKYRQVMLSARELNTESLPNRIVGQRAADLHARLRPHARAGQPGHDRRPAGAVHPRPAAGLDRRPATSTSRASTSASCRATTCSSRRSSRSSTTRRATTTSTTIYDGHGRRADRHVLAAAAVRDPLRVDTDILFTNQLTADSRILFHRRIGERVQQHRAVPDVRRRPVSGASTTAGCSGSRTPTRRRDNYPYSTPTPSRAVGSTTSATR